MAYWLEAVVKLFLFCDLKKSSWSHWLDFFQHNSIGMWLEAESLEYYSDSLTKGVKALLAFTALIAQLSP